MTGVELAELRQAQCRDRTGAIGRTLERRVVQHDDLTVAGGVDIELEDVHAVGERAAKGRQRVLRRDASGAAVTEETRPCALEAETHRHGTGIS